jgi:hypothetical protein
MLWFIVTKAFFLNSFLVRGLLMMVMMMSDDEVLLAQRRGSR